MWRSVLAVILLPALVLAQEQNPIRDSGAPNVIPEELPRSTYQAFTEQRTIRPGTTEKAAVMVSLGSELIVSPRNSSANVVPLTMEFEAAEGITVTGIRFPKDAKLHFTFQSDQIGVLGGNFPIEFKVKADRKAGLGERVLHGKLSYQAIRGNGVFPPRTMDVLLPVNVADHDTVGVKNPDYTKTFGGDAGGTPVLLWILAPLLIPLLILEFIVGGITGQDFSC